MTDRLIILTGRLAHYDRAFYLGREGAMRIPAAGAVIDWWASGRVVPVRRGDEDDPAIVGKLTGPVDRRPDGVDVRIGLRPRHIDRIDGRRVPVTGAELAAEVAAGYLGYLRPVLVGVRGHVGADGVQHIAAGRLAAVRLETIDNGAGRIQTVDGRVVGDPTARQVSVARRVRDPVGASR